MFDKHISNTETKVCPVTQVVEKTITPDKVTDMYDKVKQEVENSILRTYIIDDNDLKGIVIVTQEDFNTCTKKLLCRYTLNGTEHIMKEFIRNKNYSEINEVAYVIETLRKHFLSELSFQLLITAEKLNQIK
jgi:hypothetical protein